MKLDIRILIILTVICFAPLAAAAEISFPDCTVSKLTAAAGDDSFSCKVSEKSPLASLPLTVKLRGIKASGRTDTSQLARRFLDSQLKSARKIELRNVCLTGYCIVTADVFADDQDIASRMLADSLVERYYPPKPAPVVAKTYSKPADTDLPAPKPAAAVIGYPGRIEFDPDMTFEEAFDMISNSTTPALSLFIMWNDLERNCFIDKDTPIGVEFSGPVKVKTALDMLLRSIDAQYVIDGGVVTIASSQKNLPRRMVTKVYNIREFVNSRYPDYNNGYGNQSSGRYGNQFGSGFGNQNNTGFSNGFNNNGFSNSNPFGNNSYRSSRR